MISRAIQLSRTAAALRRQTSAVAPPLVRPPAAPAASFPPGRQTQRPFGDSAGDGGGGKIGTSDLAKRVAMDRGITLTASREIIYSVVDCITEVRGGRLRFPAAPCSQSGRRFFLTFVAPP